MSSETIRPPAGASPEALRQWGLALVGQLGRIFEGNTYEPQRLVEDIKTTLGTITNFSDLTDEQKFDLGLSASVADGLEVSDVLAELERWTESASKAAIYSALRSHQNESSIIVEQTTRESSGESFAQQITTLTADLASTDAAVSTETTARVTGDEALAQDVTTVSSTVAGHTSSITQHQASIDGIEAEWGVTINAQGQVVGLIRLDADAQESTFTVVVDKFQVAKLDGTGIVPIFQVGTVGGLSRVALAGDMLVDGAILAQHIAANSVTADAIAANSVTAAKVNVATLSAIAANVGTVTAGRIQSADGLSFWDLTSNVFQIGS